MSTTLERPSLCLSPDELFDITGYKMPSCQLTELRKQGFHRARRNALGAVVLEREHYRAVCAGQDQARPVANQPTLRQPRLRTPA